MFRVTGLRQRCVRARRSRHWYQRALRQGLRRQAPPLSRVRAALGAAAALREPPPVVEAPTPAPRPERRRAPARSHARRRAWLCPRRLGAGR
eukprot:1844283-Rhodomonas_salina.1